MINVREGATARAAAAALIAVLGPLAAAAPALAVAAPVSSGALSGRLAYFANSNDYGNTSTITLKLANSNGSDPRTIFRNATDSFGFPEFSPNGTRIAYFFGGPKIGGIDVVNVATGKITTLYRTGGVNVSFSGVAWTPSGRIVFSTNATKGGGAGVNDFNLWSVPSQGGRATQLTHASGGATQPAIAPDGDIVYVATNPRKVSHSSLWIARPDGRNPRRLLSSAHQIQYPSVSPNGKQIAYGLLTNDTTSNLDAVLINGRQQRELTPPVRHRYDAVPSWSPNGGRIAFVSSRSGRYHRTRANFLTDGYEMPATGGHVTKVVGLTGALAAIDWLTWGH